MPANVDLVRNWLKMLGALNVGAMTADEFEWRLAVLAPALAEEFADAFTPDSARAVARQCKYFPTFGEICEALTPIARAARESRRIAIEYAEPAVEAAPYVLPPAPDWCFERETRHFRPAKQLAIQPPQRTVAQQLAELGMATLRAAAAPMPRNVKRSEPVDGDG